MTLQPLCVFLTWKNNTVPHCYSVVPNLPQLTWKETPFPPARTPWLNQTEGRGWKISDHLFKVLNNWNRGIFLASDIPTISTIIRFSYVFLNCFLPPPTPPPPPYKYICDVDLQMQWKRQNKQTQKSTSCRDEWGANTLPGSETRVLFRVKTGRRCIRLKKMTFTQMACGFVATPGSKLLSSLIHSSLTGVSVASLWSQRS